MDVSTAVPGADRVTAKRLMRPSSYYDLPWIVRTLADHAKRSDGKMQVIGWHPRTGLAATPCQGYLPNQVESVVETYSHAGYEPVALVTGTEVTVRTKEAIYLLRPRNGDWEVQVADL